MNRKDLYLMIVLVVTLIVLGALLSPLYGAYRAKWYGQAILEEAQAIAEANRVIGNCRQTNNNP